MKAPSVIGPFHTFESLGEGMLISLFTSLGKKYVMVVNRSPVGTQDFDVTCDEKGTGALVLTDTPVVLFPIGKSVDEARATAPEPGGGTYTKTRYRLEAGDFALFTYVKS